MMIGTITLGRMWRARMRSVVAPLTRAASTNGCSLSARTEPRSTRLSRMATSPSTSVTLSALGPRMDITNSSRSSGGMLIHASTSRCVMVSYFPPR